MLWLSSHDPFSPWVDPSSDVDLSEIDSRLKELLDYDHATIYYKAVDSYIGKLCSIFQAHLRERECNKRLGLGNSAADRSVKDYLRCVTREQLQARVNQK